MGYPIRMRKPEKRRWIYQPRFWFYCILYYSVGLLGTFVFSFQFDKLNACIGAAFLGALSTQALIHSMKD